MLATLVVVLVLLTAVAASRQQVVNGASYDYIVIGGGTSGSMTAGRLAEAGFDVLLLEAGDRTQGSLGGTDYIMPDHLTVFDVPSQWLEIADNERWAKYRWPSNDSPRVHLVKGLGGCSIHNAMLYMRGVLADFELWHQEWSWTRVLPFYMKSESQRDKDLKSSPVHGNNGPMAVSSVPPSDRDPLAALFVQACLDAGLPFIDDFNALPRAKERCNARENHDRTGAGYYQFQIRDGQRETSARAWYGTDEGMFPWDDNSSGNKLTVLPNAHVSRIVVDNTVSPPTATGVEFFVNGDKAQQVSVTATREVILSAGAIHSPHILMLSGIGPADVLRRNGIPIISDVPGVGQNLMDGSVTSMQWELPSTTYRRCTPSSNSADCDAEQKAYYRARVGQYATPGFSAGAFFKSQSSYNRPNIQFTMHAYDKWLRNWPDGAISSSSGILTLEIADNNPWSRGSVTLRSKDPLDAPAVRCGHMTADTDVQTLMYAIKQARTVIRQSNLNGTVGRELLPGIDLNEAQLRDYIMCGPAGFRADGQCNADVRVANHHAGTCRMGNISTDASVVVDPYLRVRGVANLRVVDASIMPQLPSGNTHATCLMIGERGADFIITAAGGPRAIAWWNHILIVAHRNVAVVVMLSILIALLLCVVITRYYRRRHHQSIGDHSHSSGTGSGKHGHSHDDVDEHGITIGGGHTGEHDALLGTSGGDDGRSHGDSVVNTGLYYRSTG